MNKLKIRKAEISDEAAIVACINASFHMYISRMGKKPGPMHDDYKPLLKNGYVYCGEYDNKIVGTFVIRKFNNYMLLDNLAMLPGYQGKGFGKQLITFAENLTIENNCSELRLFTNEKMTENIVMYNKLGFTEYDRKEDEGYNRVYFKKALND